MELPPQVRAFATAARVARMATVDGTGAPSVIPICFALAAERLYTPIDEKPKRAAPMELRRVRNLAANPRLAVVVDRYDEDWRRLAWVVLRGTANLVERGADHAAALALLREKYPQYREMRLEPLPVIAMTIERVTHWGDFGGTVQE